MLNYTLYAGIYHNFEVQLQEEIHPGKLALLFPCF